MKVAILLVCMHILYKIVTNRVMKSLIFELICSNNYGHITIINKKEKILFQFN